MLKMIDSMEDVYLGRYQQMGYLDIAAKIMAVRLTVSTIIICVLICCHVGIGVSLLLGIISSVVLDIWFIKSTFKVVCTDQLKYHHHNVWKLLGVCLPLGVGLALSIYIGNAPKYIINQYMDETVQAIFGYLMMPAFVIMLLSNFIYQPMVKTLGDLWGRKDLRIFGKKVVKQCLMIIVMTLVIAVLGLLVGLPILSVLYNIDLSIYKLEFTILLLGGGVYALAYYLNVPLTTIRKQNYIAVGYAVAALLAFLFGRFFILAAGMLGATILYLSINILLVIVYGIVLIIGIKKS